MTLILDARIPVRFDARRGDTTNDTVVEEGIDDTVVEEGVDFPTPDAVAAHPSGCACCGGRSKAAESLARRFLDRARGDITPFARVVAVTYTDAGRRSVLDALASDPVVSARFRLDPA